MLELETGKTGELCLGTTLSSGDKDLQTVTVKEDKTEQVRKQTKRTLVGFRAHVVVLHSTGKAPFPSEAVTVVPGD